MSPPEPFTVITKVPIPDSLPPARVIAALQTYEALITPNPYLLRYERRPIKVEEVVNDPFFLEDGKKLQAFVVSERVPIIPGVGSWATKDIAIPCVFQSFEYGVRCCAQAQGGVTVRSSYEVRRQGEVRDGTESQDVVYGGDHYELVDISTIECGALVKPFVKMRFSAGHQALLRQVIADLLQSGGSRGSISRLSHTQNDNHR